jgi:hypothetical protein
LINPRMGNVPNDIVAFAADPASGKVAAHATTSGYQ